MPDFISVPLSKGLSAKVSPIDADRVLLHKWHANEARQANKFYARAWIKDEQTKWKHVLLHVFIMGGTGYDHKDGDRLNCTRDNLRFPPSQGHNSANQKARNKTGYKGVYLYPQNGGKYVAMIQRPKGRGGVHLGLFTDPIEAARAVDVKAREFWGEYAVLNFPTG